MTARIRTIKPEFWQDELVGSMTPIVRLTFLGLISLADDEGRMRGSSAYVASEVFRYDRTVSMDDVESALLALHASKRVTLYQHRGQRYLQIENFAKHQYIQRPKLSKLPAPGRHAPKMPVEAADKQANHVRVADASDTRQGRIGKGNREGEREGSSSLRSSLSSADADRTATPENVAALFAWYCDLFDKGTRLDIDAKYQRKSRRKTIERAIKQHGRRKLYDAIRGLHSNPWRHGDAGLSRNDITVLLRDENIEDGLERWARRGQSPAKVESHAAMFQALEEGAA